MTAEIGIRFAEPPVGALRFQPPRPVDGAGTGSFGQPPMQAAGGSEDCLTLNVWTPAAPGPHPVVVWFFGGGFESGSASPPYTDGTVLAERLGAVVVAPNYRLGAFGWLHLGGDRTNLGLQDQVAALLWVRDNITSRGGDPARVTVAGISSGAFCIGALLALPSARGLFHRAILHSGSAGRVFPLATAEAIAKDLCAAAFDDLQDLDASRLQALQAGVIDQDIGRRNLPGGRAWGVVLDGQVLPRDPLAAVADGVARDIDLLVCATRDEVQLYEVLQGAAYVPASASALDAEMGGRLADYQARFPDDSLARLRTRLLSEAVYRWPALQLVRAQTAASGRAWSSLLSAMPFGPAYGACHGSDVAFLFDGTQLPPPLPSISPDDWPVRDRMHAAWRGFIHDGDPGWPTYSVAGATTYEYADGSLIEEPAASYGDAQ
ncbi:MAG: Carboxylesterase type [Frankiales bacterium]|nr:Carboxylesterase type [Frankiales bacterium]